MEPKVLLYKNSKIGWYRFGNGPRPVICFHGYGENGSYFSFLEKYSEQQFSFFAIDLPFHGKTNWNEGLNFHWEDLRNIIDEILMIENDKQKTANYKLTLLGFSLGGRIAISLYQAIPEKIDKVVLLAPDGLKVNFWYRLSTHTWIGRRLFYFTMHYPGWFFGLLKLMKALGVVNESVFKFVKYYIDNKAVRSELYNRWICLRRLKPNLSKIKSLIQQYHTPFRLVYGKHDRIILSSHGETFRKAIEPHCIINIIESGHQVLHEKHAGEIVNKLSR